MPDDVKERYTFSNYIIDPNKYGYKKSVRILAILKRFIKNCRNKVKNSLSRSYNQYLYLSDSDLRDAANYYFRKATLEVNQFLKKDQYINISQEKDGILYYTGRILPHQHVTAVCDITSVMKDLSNTTFLVPIVENHSPIAYSIVNEVHWHDKTVKHSGVETILRYTMQYCYILEGRELVRKFGKSCERCKYLKKRTIEVAMGPVSDYNLKIAPCFYISQVDLAGPFKSYSAHHKRTIVKIWFAVFCCAATTTVCIKIMEDYTTEAILQAFIPLSCEVGYPKILLTDEGSQLVKGCESMVLNFKNIQNKLFIDMNVQFETCPVSGHYMHGRVERKIKQIRECVEKSLYNERLSLLQWETFASEIANSINNLPIGLGNKVADLENADLLTPNRLRLGRNNDRSPVGPLFVTGNPSKFIKANKLIFNSWFENWLISYVPSLMSHPKWFKNDIDLNVGDIVLFLKQEGHLSGIYQYGMIHQIKKSKDGKIRSAIVKYRNQNESVDRFTNRAVREIVMIHPIDELNIMSELGEIQSFINMKRNIQPEHD